MAETTEALEALDLDALQRSAVGEELTALARSLHDPAARQRYAGLADQVAAGELADAGTIAQLQGVIEMALETGRVRRMQGPESEQALLRLYRRLPRGAAAQETTKRANQALEALAGQVVHSVSFTPQGPGVYRLEIATGEFRLQLEINRLGVSVDSLQVGGG
jgi:hypothetical protein